MPNKGWMTNCVIRRRLEEAISDKHATFIDERDWRRLVKETQWLIKEGYSRGFNAGKDKVKENVR